MDTKNTKDKAVMIPNGLHVLEEQIPLDSGPCTDVDLLQHTIKIHGPYKTIHTTYGFARG